MAAAVGTVATGEAAAAAAVAAAVAAAAAAATAIGAGAIGTSQNNKWKQKPAFFMKAGFSFSSIEGPSKARFLSSLWRAIMASQPT